METIIGTSNRVLEVDLTTRQVQDIRVSQIDRTMYLGGKGLGLKLLYERLSPGVDPLGPDNVLVFMMGVLMGTGAPCSGRFAAITKSPLTGIMDSCSCGGPFGMSLKTAGYDGLIVTGRAEKPVYLFIDSNGVEFRDASDVWGKDIEESQNALAAGKKENALVIGPAGENRVLFANIASGRRFFGRGGMGAVMGAKMLKGIVASGGAYKILPKDPEAFRQVCKKANKYITENDFTISRMRAYGTNANTVPCNEANILPVNNFRAGSHDRVKDVTGEAMADKYKTEFKTCKPCVIKCGHVGTYGDGSVRHIPEYETVGLLGTNLGIFDTDRITEWNDICSQMGMDTISTGGTLGYAMEAGEKGLIQTDLKFGSPEGISQALLDIAHRRGLGDDLANGTRRLSDKYGGREFAMNVKGLEMPAYDPRGALGMGLSYAVANRGACHLSAYLIAQEIYFRQLDPTKTKAKPELTRFFESLGCCVNSLQTCQFTMYAYLLEPPLTKGMPHVALSFLMQYLPKAAVLGTDFSVFPQLWSSVTGIDMSPWNFLKAGDRIHVLERYMNTREGISRKDDTLPARFLKEGREGDPQRRTVPLHRMLDNYYKLRGYDTNGVPTRKTLRRLDIIP